MAFDPGTLVRAGGSALLGVVGIAALVLARGNKKAVALGAYFTLWSVQLVGNNLFEGVESAERWWPPFEVLVLYAGRIAALVWLIALWARRFEPDQKRAAIVALAVGVAVFAIEMPDVAFRPEGLAEMAGRTVPTDNVALLVLDYTFDRITGGINVALFVALPLCYARTKTADGRLRRQLAWGMLLTLTSSLGGNLLQEGHLLGIATIENLLSTAVAGTSALLWLLATRHQDGRPALLATLGTLLVLLVGLVVEAIAPDPSRLQDMSVGVYRCITAFLLGFAILRYGLLGYDPQVRTARRGTLAMGALALLFIVAQVLQNVLSSQYGLIAGGVVAGTFLFAANPIQKGIERASERQHPPAESSSGRASGNEDAFRAAVQLAFKDRRFTKAEELALADLAERLGIGARRATEIRHEIEKTGAD